jgi:hypothetical protein
MTNATLTRVVAPGGVPDYDQPATDGAELWAGESGGYLTEEAERVEGGSGSSVVVTRKFSANVDVPVAWDQGQKLTFTDPTGDEQVGEVKAVERLQYPGVPGIVKLTLEDG